jgi:hypothetical protein
MIEGEYRGQRSGLSQATPEDWDRANETFTCSAPALERQVGGNHYMDCAIQPIEYIMANNMEYCPANIIKYATRADKKGGVEDIRKIIHYAELWLEAKEKGQ